MRFIQIISATLLILLDGAFATPTHPRLPRPTQRPINDDITNFGNQRYTATLEVGGKSINVILDSGSTDLWSVPFLALNPRGGVGAFNDTGVAHRIVYGDGSTYINGTIGLAEMVIAGRTISRQAFINVTQNVGLTECGGGVCGLVGLSFDSPDDGIEAALTAAGHDGATLGKSVLSNVFDMNPGQPRFFAVAFSRLDDANETADASLAISEYDPRYAAVKHEPQNPTYPPGNRGWSILSDGIFVNGVSIPWPSHTTTTPVGKRRIGLDTGTTNFLLPGPIRDAIYAAVPGAVLSKNSSLPNTHWSSDDDVWVVPCTTAINFTISFGGHAYPIHPLDMTDMYTQVGPDGRNYTVCIGSITNGGSITNRTNDNDALFGDSFLRNVYTVFSFGNNTNPPSVQFLSVTNASDAADDFARIRQQRLAVDPPEISPAVLVALFDGQPSASASCCSHGPAIASSTGTLPSGAPPKITPSHNSQPAKYAPVSIGLLAVNLCSVLGLLLLSFTNFIRGAKEISPTRGLHVSVMLQNSESVRARDELPGSKRYS
ncbi:aspartic peptidase domain-containing protein [Mycena latifolia]|nr:aspartic peptidase domain-containing protein [Mycena latifolia]